MSPAGRLAYRVLTEEAEHSKPLCANNPLFTSDDTSHDAECAELCTCCPLRAACRSFAVFEHPAAGFWAGRRYGKQRQGADDG